MATGMIMLMQAAPKIAFTSTSWDYRQISRLWELLRLSDAVRLIVTRGPLWLISTGGTGIDSDAGIKMALLTFFLLSFALVVPRSGKV